VVDGALVHESFCEYHSAIFFQYPGRIAILIDRLAFDF